MFCINLNCISQLNLVSNLSFENLLACPSTLGEINLSQDWFDPTNASSDLFNSCNSNTTGCSVPYNLMGFQIPFTGEGYAGIITYRESNDNYREYISTKLNSKLIKGKKYKVSFRVSLADSCQFATNNIGFSFSEDTLTGSIFNPLIASFNNCKDVISDVKNWIKLDFEYEANGNECFLTIGNFSDYSNMQIQQVNFQSSSYFNYSYYYIDDVEVFEIKQLVIPNVFTPNNDGVNDVFELSEKLDYIIFDRWGLKVFESTNDNKKWNGHDLFGNELNEGIYFLLIINEDNFIQSFITLKR